jgi:uncharacterized RDD family membrane protein YckC
MKRKPQRHFHAHETARQMALEGTPLATFWQRALGLLLDMLAVTVLWAPIELLWIRFVKHAFASAHTKVHVEFDPRDHKGLGFLLVYFVLANLVSNGRSLGKWIMRTRVVSLVGERITLWQSIERVLGYGVALAELIGFFQYFWSPNRMCVQDRIAETIVVDTRKKHRATKSQGTT